MSGADQQCPVWRRPLIRPTGHLLPAKSGEKVALGTAWRFS